MAMLLFLGIYICPLRRAGCPALAIIVPCLAVPALFRRQKLAGAVLCGAAADLADRVGPLVLAARRDAADAAAAAQPARRRHRDERQPRRDRQSCCRSIPASPAAPTSGPLRCSRCSSGCRPATVSRPSGAAARFRTCRKARSGRHYASHSHNGYLDTALAHGPARTGAADRGARDRAACGISRPPIAAAMTARWRCCCCAIWLFGLYLSSLESFFLDRADPLWFTFLLAVFGLHYLARFRAAGMTAELRPHGVCATSCHQPSKSNGTCTDGRFQRRDDRGRHRHRHPIRAATSTMAPRLINSLKRG